MTNKENLERIMQLIVTAGDAKSNSMEAIQAAKAYDFETAFKKIEDAKKLLIEAHRYQTVFLTDEMRGLFIEISLLLIHSQDHLTSAISYNDMAEEFISLYKKISELEIG